MRKVSVYHFLLGVIFLSGLFLRFYNFSERIIYGPEQARSLITASRNITERFSLLGQEYFRVTSKGHTLFYSPLFPYTLIPLILSANHNPLLVTLYFALLNVFTGILLYLIAKKVTNHSVAFFSLLLFFFNSYMVYHSLFLWPYNYLPLIGLLSFYLLYLYRKNQKEIYNLLLGFLGGVGFGLQYLFSPLVLLVLILVINKSKKRVVSAFVFLSGFVLGNFPMVLFDLRNNFYNTKTLFQYLIDTLGGNSDASFNYYYLLPLWPVFMMVGGFLMYLIYKKSKLASIAILIVYLFLNLNSPKVNLTKSLGMPDGLNWSEIITAAQTISEDNPSNFNVVTLLDFDTRGYILRYPLEGRYKTKPMGVEEYPQASTIYSLSRNDYDYENPLVWELQSFAPYKSEELKRLDESYSVYKLSK